MDAISKAVAQQIVDSVKDVCDHDINFISADGRILASTDKSRVGDFHEIGREVIRQGQTLEVETDNSFFGTHRGVNIPVIHNGETIAAIGISGAPAEVRKFGYLAQKFTALILREHELDLKSSDRKSRMNYILRALVGGQSLNPQFLTEFLAEYRLSPDGKFRTVRAQLNARCNPANLLMIETSLYRAFEQTGSPLYTFEYPNEYILLLPEALAERGLPTLRRLSDALGGALHIGVGEPATLTRQAESAQSAGIALRSLSGGRSFAQIEELDLEILLGSVSAGARERFLQKVISALDEKDRALLKTYFDCGCSLKTAGEALFLHKNTLQYRLDRIGRLTGYDPREFRQGAILFMALKLLESCENGQLS